MSYNFHQNSKVYFSHQQANAAVYVIPFIEEKGFSLTPGTKVLEIGCGEGGVLKAFIEKGCVGVGIESNEQRCELGKQFLRSEIAARKVRLVSKNIYHINPDEDLPYRFDLIILKDVIEHIPEQESLLHLISGLLSDKGHIYFGFPPWQMPFGGHQQIARSKFLSRLPYFHLLPMSLYRRVLKFFGEDEGIIKELMDVKATGISLEHFERLVNDAGYVIIHKKLYLFNPIYQWKFGLKPRLQHSLISTLPYFRNFLTTCGYYLVAPDTNKDTKIWQK